MLAKLAQSIKGVGRMSVDVYYKVMFTLAAPFIWLLHRLEAVEQRLVFRVTARSGRLHRLGIWLLRLPVRFARWLLHWIVVGIVEGPAWLASMVIVLGCFFVFMFVFVFKPITYSEWVGGVWYAGLLIWLLSKAYEAWWWRGLGRIGGLVAIGLTPQFAFLLLYNGLPDIGLTAPPTITAVIKGYEYLAVSINSLLGPVGNVAWYWWLAAGCGLLILSWLLEAPPLLASALRLREALSTMVFIAAITGSVGFSHLIPAGDWQPNVQLRLEAGLKEQALYETTISLCEGLTRWFTDNQGRQTHLPVYVGSFEEAIRQIRTGRDGGRVKSEDIRKGTRAAASTLVPDVASVAVGDGVPHGVQRHIPGTIDELLRADAQMKQANVELKARANQVRASAVAVIAQVVNVPVSSVPMLRDILGEMINTTAEQISKRIVDRLPIETGIKMVQNTVETVRSTVPANSDKVAEMLFTSRATMPPGAEVTHANVALRTLVAGEIGKATEARVEAEGRSSRSRARR